MKRILILAVLASACQPRTSDVDVAKHAYEPVLYTDRVTGCEYLASGNSSDAMTPRIAADGKTHMGCKAVAP